MAESERSLMNQPSSERGEAGAEKHESKIKTANETKRLVGDAMVCLLGIREKNEVYFGWFVLLHSSRKK